MVGRLFYHKASTKSSVKYQRWLIDGGVSQPAVEVCRFNDWLLKLLPKWTNHQSFLHTKTPPSTGGGM
jgi:hypothetical protein